MARRTVIGATVLAAILTTACAPAATSGLGFTLPAGEPQAGRAAFVRLGCNSCHTVRGSPELRQGVDEPEMTVPLGGTTVRIETYGQLVTSIINPSHRISQRYLDEVVEKGGASRMRNYNEVMTVAELADLVVFLQDQYDVSKPEETVYPPYYEL